MAEGMQLLLRLMMVAQPAQGSLTAEREAVGVAVHRVTGRLSALPVMLHLLPMPAT